MAVPADGIDRLIHYVDARLAQLGLTKEDVARRGGPAVDTLSKLRRRTDHGRPTIATLSRYDAALGWQPGSSAVTMLGGMPQSITTRRPGKKPATPALAGNDIVARLTTQLRDELDRLQRMRDSIDASIARTRSIYEGLAGVSGTHDATAEAAATNGEPTPDISA
jgi:hypothetical protein